MSVSKLLEDFQKIDKAPIPVSAVVDELRARGITEEIRYVRDDALDPRLLRGYLYRVSIGSGDQKTYSSTIVHARMPEEDERVVCTKELIHILDPERLKVADRGRLQDLFSKIVLPPEVADIVEEEEHVSTDRDAIVEAVALLFPLALRKSIYPDYLAKKISLEWIADKVELPIEYVTPVMNGYWPHIVRSLIARRHRIESARMPAPEPSNLDPILG